MPWSTSFEFDRRVSTCSYLFGPYSRLIGSGINVVWLLIMVVGLGSIYFHATLSFAGQLIDEIAIAWVLLAAFTIWMPSRILARWPFRGDRLVYKYRLS